MDDIIDSQIDSALTTIITAILAFVLDNFLVVLLLVVVVACFIILFILNSKRNMTIQLMKRTAQLQQDIIAKLREVLVEDTFRDLELGLAQGETERRLQHMEKAAFRLHQQSEQLGVKLQGYQHQYFSPYESLHQAEGLIDEAEDLHERVERYLHDLSNIQQSARRTDQHIRQLKDRLDVVAAEIMKLEEDTGYPLDVLKQQFIRAEEAYEKTDQLAAFDAVQAKPDSDKLGRLIEDLHQRTLELRSNLKIMDQIRDRLKMQTEQIQQQIERDQLRVTDETPMFILQKTDVIMEQLDSDLRMGQGVDLRAAASEIELILQQALDKVDGHQ
jgi:chromosome segregation ATPase